MRRVFLICLILALPLVAQEPGPPPETSMRPEPRPAAEEADVAVAPDDPVEVAKDTPPITPTDRAATPSEHAACLADLDALGTSYELADRAEDPDDPACGILTPVTVSEVVPGIALDPPATIRCETARALADWTSTHLAPSAELLERGELTGLVNASGYVCRRRNNLPTGPLSEHAFGNAIDISEFRFAEGDPLPVAPRDGGSIEAAFQRAIRAAACLHFTTVIGPGTDAAHANHLHFDRAARREGWRYCR
ncbi:extensin family protein [Pontivivens ytuae]|uniref:Extensin family protein n=1 Tax=Pontivivens ytuae TaxID=2789856 RepID=A0A7S9QE82_9RHOB|nr:extensin family protein [Pontivivens ytuae]QPH55778.1 extensin family protein [Pontivivens ytuae]